MKKTLFTALIAVCIGFVVPSMASARSCATPTAHNTRLTISGGSCHTAKSLARATNEQYYLGDGNGYIDPYTWGPRIWHCYMEETRRGRDMVVHVYCDRGRTYVSMTWLWRNVWMD